MDKRLYEESIILIGPSGAGKSTVAEELRKITGMPRMCLDRIANNARDTGLRSRFKNADEFNYYMISEVLKKIQEDNSYGIVDFGAGHSVYDDRTIFEKIKFLLKSFNNIVLLLPDRDDEESLRIMRERSTGDTSDNKKFLESPCNEELATMIVYGDNRQPSEIAEEIITRIKERQENKAESKEGVIQRRINKDRWLTNYTNDDQMEYEQFVAEEPEGAVQEVIGLTMQLYEERKKLQNQMRAKEALGEDVSELREEYSKIKNKYYNSTSCLTDFILKHQTDNDYINSIIEQMPFMARASFINESVLQMMELNNVVGYAHYQNAMDVYERNIDKEVRKMLETKSFKELSQELYLDVGTIGDPLGSRQVVPKYDCINFTLFRIDEELQTGIFAQHMNFCHWGGKQTLRNTYGYGRNIYENRMPPNIKDIPTARGFRDNYLDTLYWAQKITTDDRTRLGLSEINSVAAEIQKDLTLESEQQVSIDE